MRHSSSYPSMINSESGLDSEHTVSHFTKGLWVMWPAIEICANAGDSQRRKNIFLWPMISISIDSQGGHLGENPFHFRKLCSTFLRVEPEHGHVYEAALVILMCSQYWEDSSGMVRPSKCIQICNNDHIKTFKCRDGAHDGWAMLLAWFSTRESRFVAGLFPCLHCKWWKTWLSFPSTMEEDKPANPCWNRSWTLLSIILILSAEKTGLMAIS